MSAAPAMVSIGDGGVLNRKIPKALSDVWIDRDLGWLDFNERVLAEALDNRTPLLERAKFLAIVSSNLDEFFMKRVAVLRKGSTPERVELLHQVRKRIMRSLREQAECFKGTIIPELASHGVHLRKWDELTGAQKAEAGAYFDSEISPALTPLVFDPAHPFPFLSNLSTSLSFLLEDPQSGVISYASYARVKIPSVLKQWVALEADVPPGLRLFVPLYEVIWGNVAKLYGGMKLTGRTLFRLTRDAEIDLDDASDEELRDQVAEQIRLRRYEPVVRLEFAEGANPSIREGLRERFELSAADIYDSPGELDYTSLFQIAGLPIPALRDPAWSPLPPLAIANNHDIFAAIRAGDILVHHPYESFEASVEHFIAEAAKDPETVAVKMTAYRIGDDTPFVQSLVKAAESGKQVACVIELKARFDEERNLHWATELERAGAHVTFGVQGLKTHAKLALVVRNEASGLRSYVHIGTGNYHVRTARLYADVGLFTCNPVITGDVINLFHHLTGHSHAPACSNLLVAPVTMRARLIELIRREIANKKANLPARIIAKMNQLEDPEIIDALCDAAVAGVPVELIVRGFCCLRPGVPGRSDGVRVRSIIGRYLEHSRIFHFAAALDDPLQGDFFIGSADWMYRNLSKRVEVITPVLAKEAKGRLWEILDIILRDRRQAWMLQPDGTYSRLEPGDSSEGPEALGTHAALMELARHRSE
ncbi:MAG TPA: polyphosphate kinase 1 [Bryobacteraceae bacterium]|nr:polyphosphate kinase 1 [Bryobacteraceae bacterium]